MSILALGEGLGDLALFKDLALLLPPFSYKTQLNQLLTPSLRPFFSAVPSAPSDTLTAHKKAWCRMMLELPGHKGVLGITPLQVGVYYCRTYYKAVRVGGGGEWKTRALRYTLQASGIAAVYWATANMVFSVFPSMRSLTPQNG